MAQLIFPTYPYYSIEQIDAITCDDKFSRYVESITAQFNVETITIRHVEWFGSRPGFISVFSDMKDNDGNTIPGAAVLRGDAVAILVVLNGTHSILVEQSRSPVGESIFELPAGALDKSLDPIEIAITEIKEEVDPDLIIDREDFTTLFTGYVSPGGSDERITLVSVDIDVTQEYIDGLQDSIRGAEDEDETIKVHVVPMTSLANIPDMKTQLAYQIYKSQERTS